jgi:hypothetical protein
MAARAAATALCLAALAWAGRLQAQDDPACARYQEPMAYNACLARHGPKANDVGAHSGETRARDKEAEAPSAGFPRWRHVQRIHGRIHMEFPVK